MGQEVGVVTDTRVDSVGTPESHVFKADRPGLEREKVNVEVRDGRTPSIPDEKMEEKDSWRCLKCSIGQFSRQFALPENAKVQEVGAKMDNGVLTVTIPKVRAEISRVRSNE